ncbi:MAG: helix-turn-helix transcriptional regulator [Betaproteobacteria bacterium]|nr:helix-turn-helix transcriptional regulator [Betaproteobacteria bacterium]
MTSQSQWAASPQDVNRWNGPLADRTGDAPAEAVVRERRGIAGYGMRPAVPVADRPAKPIARDGGACADAVFGLLANALSLGVLVLSDEFAVLAANGTARAMLDRGEPVRLDATGRARAVSAGDQRQLEALRDLAASRERERTDKWSFSALRSSHRGLPRLFQARTVTVQAERALCLLIHDLDDPPEPSRDVLSALFGVTAAECDLALALLRGISLRDHAVMRGVSHNTVKTQLSRVLEKTGTHRQSQLVGLLRALAP